MILRAFRYSFAQAKTRALKSRLLTPDEWHFLLKSRGLEEMLRYLSTTHYAEALSGVPGGKPGGEVVSSALYDDLFRDYAKVLKAAPRGSADIARSLLLRYDAENLKTILRGISEGIPPAEIRSLLFGLGALSTLPVDALFQVQEASAAIGLLRSTIFYLPLTHALPQFLAQGRTFPLEVAIDIAVFENMVKSLKSLKGLDQRGARDLIGDLIDFENLCWVARFRNFYGLSPEEAINYTLRGGRHIRIRNLGKLARSLDLRSFLAALPKPYSSVLGEANDWTDIRPLFEAWFANRLHRVFQKDPFQVRLQLSYLLLKESEVKALERLLSALALKEPPESLLKLVGLPLAEGAHV